MIHLDTQVVIWLYLRDERQFPRRARSLIARARDVRVSPMVLLELDNLVANERIKPPSIHAMIDDLGQQLGGLTVSDARLADVVDQALSIGWTRDPFDRLIVSNAKADSARLITSDARILKHFADAVWD